jgi:selenide, water dikinase
MKYRLTEYSHGAGCGCKLSPGVLSEILGHPQSQDHFPSLLVGTETKDDAAVVDLDGSTAIVSTTDFFMPIVDDPHDFGAIAATNAISDIYAMAAEPIVAIAILGWPIDKIPASVAGEVLAGARGVCAAAGIPLAGGHSIDAPEPIFGLAVTGKASVTQIKKNKDGKPGDLLYLTKPLGIGLVTTAQKQKMALPDDLALARSSMLSLNKIGRELGSLSYVRAITDVTGFGLGGHLLELCDGANTAATIDMDAVPVFNFVHRYLSLGCIPGGTNRNWKTYGHRIEMKNEGDYRIIADPQTSGGLLISVDPGYRNQFEALMAGHQLDLKPIGKLTEWTSDLVIRLT